MLQENQILKMARKTIPFKGHQFDQNVSRLAGGWVGVQCPVQNGPQVQKWPAAAAAAGQETSF